MALRQDPPWALELTLMWKDDYGRVNLAGLYASG